MIESPTDTFTTEYRILTSSLVQCVEQSTWLPYAHNCPGTDMEEERLTRS